MAPGKSHDFSLTNHQVKIVQLTRDWIGTPYHHQQSVKHVGCDCLGLVRGVYEELTHLRTAPIFPYSRDWADVSGQETLIKAAQDHLIERPHGSQTVGDVVIFRFRKWLVAKHTGILVSEGTMVHAIEGTKVCEVHLGGWWRRHMAGVFSFPNNDQA